MSVTIPKESIEAIGNLQLVDGDNPGNARKVLDAGDTIIVQDSFLWFDFDKKAKVTAVHTASAGSVKAFLQDILDKPVDVFVEPSGKLDYLVYRRDKKLGGSQVINFVGQDVVKFPGEVSAAAVQKEIETVAGKCPESLDGETNEECVRSQADFAKSATIYNGVHEAFQKKYDVFFADTSLTHDELEAFVQSAQAYAEAYQVYMDAKKDVEDRVGSL